jgi:zinc D-Ala-D-Ala carboxypeptidase
MEISKNITLAEATKSNAAIRAGIKNIPDETQLLNMQYVAKEIFEPLREHFGVPIGISSFFRNKETNKLVGGAEFSQHQTGESMDIDADIFGGITNKQIFDWIKKNCIFDQLIWEFGDDSNPAWVHVSKCRIRPNRMQILKVSKTGTRSF